VDKRSLVLYLSGLAAAGAVVGLAASCSDQPRIKCTAGHGHFALVYTRTSGDANCGPNNGLGDGMGVEAYNYPLPEGNNLDPRRGRVGFQPDEVTEEMGHRPAASQDPVNKPYSIGDWAGAEADSNEFCNVPVVTPIEQNLGPADAIPPDDAGMGGSPAYPAIRLSYQWSNVRFYATALAPGNQMVADLSYSKTIRGTDGGADSTCTAQFKVVGLWPQVSCDSDDHMGIDESKCSTEPDNSKGRPTGSGISPDLATRCHPELKMCVLAKEVPSFK
jgi:hypothetical protein